MNKIQFPLEQGMKSPEVGDLQAVLQQLLDRDAILPGSRDAQRELSEALRPEEAEQFYGDVTTKLVSIFQDERKLDPHGAVDEPTAGMLNALLEKLGLIEQPAAPTARVVSGKVRREDGLPLQGVRVHAAHETDQRSIRLGEDITDAEGRYTIRYELLPGLEGVDLRVSAMDEDGQALQSSAVVRNARTLEIIDLTAPMAGRPTAERRIEGRIVLEHGLPAEKVRLRLYRRDFGGKATLLAETSTLAGGQYAFTYDPGDQAMSLEVRAVTGANEEIPLSKPLNDLSAKPRAELNLVAPGDIQPLAAEYRRLSADLTPHIGQMATLAQAKENDEQQDITVLNRATGWDARLIALAATTERLSADPEVQLSQEAVYGLLRAGLPSDKLLLAQVEPDVAEQALKTVRDAGIVELTDPQIGDFKRAFTTFSNRVRLNIPAPGSRSTYGALLKSAGLPQDAQDKFVPVYLNHRGGASQLWEETRNAGLDNAQISKLQLQGKLAFLAGNSEAMTGRLLQKQINDPAQLVEQDLHHADAWATEVFEQAGIPASRRDNLTDADKEKLDDLIPVAYAAKTVEGRLDAYTEDMARKVRLSYPTQVVGRLMETDDKFKLPAAHDATVTLLKNAAGQGFRLGETPVVAFLETHIGVTAGMAAPDAQAAKQQLQTLQRVYQITPGNEAMPVMMKLGMTSAYDVTAYSEAKFTDLYDGAYFDLHGKTPPPGESRLVYRKAKQVSSVTCNLFTIAAKLESEPPVAGLSAPVAVRESVRNELIKRFPTMESLFGSMDFCECEHCRSVLSPAAYLVDLLQFVDPEPGVWGNFLAQWQATHNGQDYPHQDANGDAMRPYDVLIERRPDLPHIPLTCENTHTALPYIDIVNEILEYYVAHGKLEEEAAHDTGEATTAELLAEPQNVIREAYDRLRKARYPLNLPFDLWIETVRQFCNYFETPLPQVLEAFRQSDDLFAPAQPFDRAGVFMESLGLSPAEVAIFTNPDPLAAWHELYGFQTAAEATTVATDATTGQRIDLNSAKALSRRLGVTYKEITEIIQTEFVNPELAKLAILYKLGVSIHDARFYLDHQGLLSQDPDTLSSEDQQRRLEVQAFDDTLQNFADQFQMPKADLDAMLQAIPFDGILVLADPDAGCNFDLTTLRYANGNPADAMVFLRINLFVRLWRKLGWSIDETDRALSAFIPQSAPFDENPANLAKQPLRTTLIYLAHLKALDKAVSAGKESRLKLLSLWSGITTTGKNPLYAQLFLTRSVLRSDPVFDHSLGQYLTDPTISLQDHILALQGALGLTAGEIGRILADSGQSLDNAILSLPNVSLLYQHSLLAKALRLSIRELIALKQLSGFDPFKPLHPHPLVTIEEDHPFSHTLRFVEIVAEVRDSGLKIEDLDYLLRHRFDETGKYRPTPDATLALLKTLAEGVRAIRAEHAAPDDPGALDEEALRQKLQLALPPAVVERFLAMIDGTVEFTATQRGVAAADQLMPEAFADEPAIREVRYNATRQEQKLTFRGVLFDAEKTALNARLPKPVSPNPHVPSPLLSSLLDDVQQQARSFFEKHLQKQAANMQPAFGFLDAADFDLLFDRDVALAPGETEQDRLRKQRSRLAEAFLPYLQQRLIRQFIVQTMTAYTDANPALVESLLTDERLLALPGSKPLLASFAGTGERGVSAAFFDSDDLSGASQATTSLVNSADTTLKEAQDAAGNPLNPANSARFEGYLEVPTAGAYRFYIELDKQNAQAELRFEHLPAPVFLHGMATADNATLGDQPDEFLELKPGVPYRFSLELKNLGGGEARLLVQGESLPKDGIEQLMLYPLNAISEGENAILLLTKALQLVQSLGLSEQETRYLLTHAADFAELNLSALPTVAGGNTLDDSQKLFAQFLRLAGYSQLKRTLAGGTDDLLGIFEANGTGDPDKVYALIARLTRRDEATVRATAETLVDDPKFESEKPLIRLWEALQVVERFGAPAASLQKWTRIISPAETPELRFEIARDLKEAIKARFEPETWQRVAQPIFDKLRQRQRDALVSHVMHQHGFDRLEQLYEHFLIDPGMEPVVQTSRIRLAISSLQLFIQRCLLNLEKKVQPSTINSKQWEWMKRYRIWEANRKIFLFPENWLEPEFRDDKTHLFSELEGALLQGDVSSDLVEDAFLNYLKKLDELARLDIVAMHIEDNPDPARRTLHVFGRTYSQPHKYFYRRYAHQMWTPWEPVSAEIEGDHLAPVVWRDRLYLFWVTFMDKPNMNAKPESSEGSKPLAKMNLPALMSAAGAAGARKKIDVQLHWSEYLQGEWSTRQSSEFFPVGTSEQADDETQYFASVTVSLNFDPRDVFIHVSKEPFEDGQERGVFVHMKGPEDFLFSFYLAGRNSEAEKGDYSAKPANVYPAGAERATRYSGSGAFIVRFKQRITTEPGKRPNVETDVATPSILRQGNAYTLLPSNNNLTALGVSEATFQDASHPDAVEAAIESGLDDIASLMKPVFYQDNQHTLFVEPSVIERTIEDWQDWVTRTPRPDPDWWRLTLRENLTVKAALPEIKRDSDPDDPRLRFRIDQGSFIKPKPVRDWLVNESTVVDFDGVLIGPTGQSGLQIQTDTVAETVTAEGMPMNVNPGSHLATGNAVVLTDAAAFGQSNLIQAASGLKVVGKAGLNPALV